MSEQRITLKQEIAAEYDRKVNDAVMLYLGSEQTPIDYRHMQETVASLTELYGFAVTPKEAESIFKGAV